MTQPGLKKSQRELINLLGTVVIYSTDNRAWLTGDELKTLCLNNGLDLSAVDDIDSQLKKIPVLLTDEFLIERAAHPDGIYFYRFTLLGSYCWV